MPGRLGLIAGGGHLPARLIAAAHQAGRDVYVIALDGQAEPATVEGTPHAWVRIGAVGRIISILRKEGVDEIVLAGKVERPSLSQLRPDWRAMKFLAARGGRLGGDDELLAAIIAAIEEEEGIRVLAPETLLDELPAPRGALGRHHPTTVDEADIALGVDAARQLGARDIGQAAVVQQGQVLALEAADGTDQLIARAGALRRDGRGPILVKLPKPQQDGRADPPVIGPETVRRAAAAGFSGIAVQAGGTLVVDRPEVARLADEAGLFVVGIDIAGGS